MSKICDRNYSGNSMYTMKMIEGIASCPSCSNPALCHGKPVKERALFWALCYRTGSSSEAIAKHMTGFSAEQPNGFSPPSDASDRLRCIKLLELIPEWLPRLDEMRKYDAPDQRTDGFVINSSGITADHNTWAKQIPMMVAEGNL